VGPFFPSNAHHSTTLIDVISATPPSILVLCLRPSDDYEKTSAKHNSRLFLWTQPRYYTFFQMGMEYIVVTNLEKAGGPMTESRSWTALVKEKTRLTPPSTPAPESVDTPIA